MTPEQGIVGIIVRQLLELAGLAGWERTPEQIALFCHALSFGEFMTGVLLLFPRTQWLGKSGAILLHSSLLLALGPFGLNHHAGVLLWNLCFLCLVPILFPQTSLLEKDASQRSRLQTLVIAATWSFPLSGLIGIADNWPSWQLYSSRPETWILSVHEADRELLPTLVRPHVSDPAPLSEWCPVRLDRWSLQQTKSPMYPEDRFQGAVIKSLLEKSPKTIRFRVDISEPEFPFWWSRRQRQIDNRVELSGRE